MLILYEALWSYCEDHFSNKCFIEQLGIAQPDYYSYLNQSGAYTVDGVDDVKEFRDTMVSRLPVYWCGLIPYFRLTVLDIELCRTSIQWSDNCMTLYTKTSPYDLGEVFKLARMGVMPHAPF